MTKSAPTCFFCEQSVSHSCGAACVVMALARSGRLAPSQMPVREQELADQLCWPESIATELGSSAHLAPDSTASFRHLESEVADGHWIVVLVRPEPLQSLYRSRRPTPGSRHGSLHGSRIDHALLLVDADERGYTFLDPWLRREHQPIELTREEFAALWVGIFISVFVADTG